MTAEIFARDHQLLQQKEKEISRTLLNAIKGKDFFESETGIKIHDIEQYKTIVSDPEKYFVDHVLQEEKTREQSLKKMFGPRANIAELIEKIYLPANWNKVLSALEAIKRIRWELFTIVDGQIILSDLWHSRLLQKCYFVCHTPAQQQRLDYCRRTLAFLEKEVPALLESEIKESNKDPYKFERVKGSKDFYKDSLPVGIKFKGYGSDRTLEIDAYFVIDGFSTFLPEFRKINVAPQTVNIEYRVCYYLDELGMKTSSIFIEGQDVPTDKLRRFKSIVTPFIHHIVNGRLQTTGKRGKVYTNSGLVEQLN